MSNSIWKTPDQKPDGFKPHRILVIYEAHDEPELMFSQQYDTLTDHRYVNRWCYWDEFIAQADKAERLAEENEAMREEFEVWHGNHKCVLEDNERLQKAVDLAVDALDDIQMTYGVQYDSGAIRFRDAKDIAVRSKKEIKQLIKGNQ